MPDVPIGNGVKLGDAVNVAVGRGMTVRLGDTDGRKVGVKLGDKVNVEVIIAVWVGEDVKLGRIVRVRLGVGESRRSVGVTVKVWVSVGLKVGKRVLVAIRVGGWVGDVVDVTVGVCVGVSGKAVIEIVSMRAIKVAVGVASGMVGFDERVNKIPNTKANAMIPTANNAASSSFPKSRSIITPPI
jgi:hypothetical protein